MADDTHGLHEAMARGMALGRELADGHIRSSQDVVTYLLAKDVNLDVIVYVLAHDNRLRGEAERLREAIRNIIGEHPGWRGESLMNAVLREALDGR